MGTRLTALCFDATDPLRLARFWAAALTWEIRQEAHATVVVVPTDGSPFTLVFVSVPGPKVGKNRIHLDLVSESPEDQMAMVDRLLAQGASRIDIGQGAVEWAVLADPEGNEFCVVRRGEFLATTGLLGSVVFEPADYPAVGRFWSEATGWPVVYDQDGDMAIRDPSGRGPFVTFGPPIRQPEVPKSRLRFAIAPPADGDQEAEVERLTNLGGRPVDAVQGSKVVMADPEGNEFYVLTPR